MVNRETKGLTLIEIMVVVVIAALLFTVLLLFVFPSDDRRCRLEAERLAAYMTSASAESVMREGGTRVVFAIADNSAEREVSRASADLTVAQWEEDPRAAKYQVREPIKIDSVNTPAVPELTLGTAYVVFQGRETEGAVVVLVLEDAVYSVIVSPSGGEIKVKKGRAPIPGASQFETPKLPDLTGYLKNSKGMASNLAGAGIPPPMAIKRRPSSSKKRRTNRKSKNRRGKAKPRKRRTAPKANSPGPPKAVTGRKPTKPRSSKAPKAKAQRKKSTAKTSKTRTRSRSTQQPQRNPVSCRGPSDCFGRGAWLVCLGGRCVPEWRRRSVILVDAKVTEPKPLASVLDTKLHHLITSGELNLIMNLNQPQSFLIQGTRMGSVEGFPRYAQHEDMPAYPTAGPSTENPFTGLVQCVGISCQGEFAPDGEDAEMTLFIHDNQALSNDCQYQTLELINVVIELQVDLSQPIAEVHMAVRGTLRRASARRFRITDDTSLADFLEDNDVAPNADSVGDGVPDSWEFEFSGPGTEVLFNGNAAANTDVRPENCE